MTTRIVVICGEHLALEVLQRQLGAFFGAIIIEDQAFSEAISMNVGGFYQ
jgi:hypothetical protein